MLALHEGLVLYHGSYAEVREIDLTRCAPGKDFGRGFRTEKSIGHLVFEGSDVCEG